MRPIDADNFYIPKGFFNDGINVPKMFKLLKMQSTIDPESLRPKGKWGEYEVYPHAHSIDGYPCSVCGIIEQRTTTYCPNCGADMRG